MAAALDSVCVSLADTHVQRGCHGEVEYNCNRKKVCMKVLAELLQTAKEQLTGKRQSRIWTAYTRTSKVVVIDGDRVVKVIDPRKQKGGCAK